MYPRLERVAGPWTLGNELVDENQPTSRSTIYSMHITKHLQHIQDLGIMSATAKQPLRRVLCSSVQHKAVYWEAFLSAPVIHLLLLLIGGLRVLLRPISPPQLVLSGAGTPRFKPQGTIGRSCYEVTLVRQRGWTGSACNSAFFTATRDPCLPVVHFLLMLDIFGLHSPNNTSPKSITTLYQVRV